MSVWDTLRSFFFEPRGTLESPSVPISGLHLSHMADAVMYPETDSGLRIGPDGAVALTAVQACVRLIAETFATLPLPVYKRLDNGGKDRAPSHPLYKLLHDRPNPETTSVNFRETLQAHLLLWGNAFAEIERNGGDAPIGLWPIHPSRVSVRRENGRKSYVVEVDGVPVKLSQDEVLHIPGLSFDGLVGISPIQTARQAIGLTAATEKYGAKFFGSSARPTGYISFPGDLKDDAKKRLRAEWQGIYGGTDNAHKTPVLDRGMKWEPMDIPPEHAQFLETRGFQTAEIARLFRVPPHMIGDVERSTSWGAGIEAQTVGFLVFCLRPWLVRWEQVLNWELFGDRSPFFCEFLVDGLLRGDSQARANALAIQRQNGIINADEWREIENMNPQPGGQGKVYLVPLNLVPADRVDDVIDAQTRPPAPPAPEPEPDDDERAVKFVQPGRLLVAQRALIEDAAARMIRKEAKAVRSLAKKPKEEFGPALEAFYERHTQQFAEALLPALRVHFAITNGGPLAEAEAIRIAHYQTERALAEIQALNGDVATSIDALMATWERERAKALADELTVEELDARAA